MDHDPDIPPRLERFIAGVLSELPVHRGFVVAALTAMTVEELRQLDAYLAYCTAQGLSDTQVVACYLTIVEDTVAEQIFFRRHGRYRHDSFDAVARQVYFDPEYMNRYMYGLAISGFLWPNHLALARFFFDCLPTDRSGRYLEVGPGHGYFMMTAMRHSSYREFVGVDISAASIAQTRAVIRHFLGSAATRLEMIEAGFLEADALTEGSYEAIVMGEVLEHVERPGAFMRRCAELAAPGAFIYMTTCVNAPAVDHIYLWRSVADLEATFVANGLQPVRKLLRPYKGKTVGQCEAEALAINVAFVLETSR
jgi:2-polyprenyl-3-methyl-5-hydroxy-6-metoxy-1,4-benzoquinol methylase